MNFFERLRQNQPILFDGAMGTQIQALNLSEQAYDGQLGCNEILNLTIPGQIQKLHEAYFAAGAEVVETNTLGANRIVLAEYGLSDRTIAINRAAAQIARRAAEAYSSDKPRFVAGSMGPGTKLISLGQTDFATMHRSYYEQAQGLIEGGIDVFIIETCQDLLAIKTGLIAVMDAMKAMAVRLPIIVSVTVETTGTLLIGSDISAVITALSPYPIDVLGLNCATGPEMMWPYIQQLCQQFAGAVSCMPNAGLPQNIDGRTVYTLPIEEFVSHLRAMVVEAGVRIVGGCCGTTPEYIRALAAALVDVQPAERRPVQQPAVASLFTSQNLRQDPAPFFVGERANTNGSKQFREYLLADDWDGIVAVATEQQRHGAHGIDLCVAYTGRDERADMQQAVKRIATQCQLPLFIDSTDAAVIELALQHYGGRPVINSINLEEGEGRADKICQLAKRYGAALICLTIDEKGMALEVGQKVHIARRIYDIAVGRHGLRPEDLIFDPLTFTLGSGEATLKDAGIKTLQGIQAIKEELPGVFTLLGVSNVSFGLAPQAREVLNSVFLAEAVRCGLDLAIVNVKKIFPLYQIPAEDLEQCLNLIYNRGPEPLLRFISHFEKKSGRAEAAATDEGKLPLEEIIRRRVINGNRSGLTELLQSALQEKPALAIINDWLIPAMKTVGELFGAGKMQLPFVLQSAEVMKHAVDILQPFMEKSAELSRTSIVLATVRGDVHDIGKNLVDIILTNNGFNVYNLGIKCEIETIIQKALEVKADAIGMSGLLVKSTVVMKENLEELQRRGIRLPVLLGGAALTRKYVDEVCAPIFDEAVIYCADAFEGLQAMNRLKEGTLTKATAPATTPPKIKIQSDSAEAEPIRRDIDIPVPPFWGDRMVTDIDLDEVYAYLTESVLFRGRWGYRRGSLSAEEYQALIEAQVKPEFEALKKRCKEEKWFVPKVIYGYYPCHSDGDEMIIYHPQSGEPWLRFTFPRQKKAPFRSIADFFLPVTSERRDVIAFQVVTIGERASQEAERLYRAHSYKDYLLFHGLSVESAEALAEYWHKQIRRELGIAADDGTTMAELVVQKYRGSRYSFGYPACPDLSENRKVFTMLRPERIGVRLTEEDQMVPEQTTSAFIVHHPQAKYFAITEA